MPETRPVIVLKRKRAHSGAHGGAWKVAYADFVTAMMALFIVLWLMNSSKQIQESVGGYFKDPTGKGKLAGTTQAGSAEKVTAPKDNIGEDQGGAADRHSASHRLRQAEEPHRNHRNRGRVAHRADGIGEGHIF